MPIGAARAALLMGEALAPVAPTPLVAPVLLDSGSDGSTGASITSASIETSAGSLLICVLGARADTAPRTVWADPTPDGIDIDGTWTLHQTTIHDTTVDRYASACIAIARCDGGTGTLEFGMAASATSWTRAFQIYELTQGFVPAHDNYPAITNESETTSLALDLDDEPASDSLIVSALCHHLANASAFTQPAGHTALERTPVGVVLDLKSSYCLTEGSQENTWTGLDNNEGNAGVLIEILQTGSIAPPPPDPDPNPDPDPEPGPDPDPNPADANLIVNSKWAGSGVPYNWVDRQPGEGVKSLVASPVAGHQALLSVSTALTYTDRALFSQEVEVVTGEVYTLSVVVQAVDADPEHPGHVVMNWSPFGSMTLLNGTLRPEVGSIAPDDRPYCIVQAQVTGTVRFDFGMDRRGSVTLRQPMIDHHEGLRGYVGTDPDLEAVPGLNLLDNSIFEGEGVPTNWAKQESGAGTVTLVAADAAGHQAMKAEIGEGGGFAQLRQTFVTVPEQTYILSAYCKAVDEVGDPTGVVLNHTPFGSAVELTTRPTQADLAAGQRVFYALKANGSTTTIVTGLDKPGIITLERPQLDQGNLLRGYVPTSPATGGGGGGGDIGTDWSNGWAGHDANMTGWMGEAAQFPLSAFGTNWRGDTPTQAGVNFGTGASPDNGGLGFYRQITASVPVYSASRPSSLVMPETDAFHLEFYYHFPSNAETGNGKRWGWSSPYANAAGGASVAGVSDTTTSGLNRAGAWSSRWLPARRYWSYGRGVDKFSLYTYNQNRRLDFGVTPDGNGRNFGMSRFSDYGTAPLGRWVRCNWTIILNTDGQKNGRQIMWIDGQKLIDTTGIMWQSVIGPYRRPHFYLAHMFGGVSNRADTIPLVTFKEWYNRFRVGVTTRANALANPWPFA